MRSEHEAEHEALEHEAEHLVRAIEVVDGRRELVAWLGLGLGLGLG